MRRTAMLWEVFVSRFEEALEQYERHRLTAEEAGELLLHGLLSVAHQLSAFCSA